MGLCPFKPMQLLVALPAPEGYPDAYPWKPGDTVLFLGEIEQMPGHIAVATKDGKVHFGYHDDNFRLPTEDEV